MDLAKPEGSRREEDIAAALAVAVLEDILAHFLPRRFHWCWYGSMWIMVRLGRELRSRTYYILGVYYRLFRNVSVQYPSHNSDHYMVTVCLLSPPLSKHDKYLGRRTQIPL